MRQVKQEVFEVVAVTYNAANFADIVVAGRIVGIGQFEVEKHLSL